MESTRLADGAPKEVWSEARFFHAGRISVIARSRLSSEDHARINACALGLAVDHYEALARTIRSHLEAVAADMLSDDSFAADVDALPFLPGDCLVALGDSITADSYSWVEILDVVLRLRGRDVHVINQGVSGDTTTEAIERIDVVAAARPQWVVQLLGMNDVRRHGTAVKARIVSLEESMRNFAALGELISQDVGAHLVRMTPTTVIPSRVATWQPFRAKGITWHAEEVEDLALRLRGLDPSALDLHGLTAGRASGSLVGPDGVHPTLAGQQTILRALVAQFPARTV